MFVQNFIEPSIAVNELSWSQRKKNSDEHNTVRRYRADSNINIANVKILS